jgi:TolA-binding protein
MPEVYFLKAFILDEDLDKKDDAKKAYTDLINEFPDNALSAQAAVLLDQLYMSDEELIEMWKTYE